MSDDLQQRIENLRQQNLSCKTCGEVDLQVVNVGKKSERIKEIPKVKIPARAVRLTDSSLAPVPIKVIDYEQVEYLWIGEAPGDHEDREGEGFIGRSGKYLKLTLIRRVAQIDLNACAFSNILKCHPVDNRDPYKNEILACKHWVDSEIQLIKPRAIFTVGKFATLALIDKKISEAHGQVYEYQGIPVMPLYHPAGVNRAVSPVVLERDYREILPKLEEHLRTKDVIPNETKVLIDTPAKFTSLLKYLKEKALSYAGGNDKWEFGFDIETNESDWTREVKDITVDPVSNEVAGMSFFFEDYPVKGVGTKTSVYLPLCQHNDKYVVPQDLGEDSWEWVLNTLLVPLQLALNNGRPFIHNAAFEMESLEKYGLVFSEVHDTQLMAYILRYDFVSLKEVTHKKYGVETVELKELYDLKKQQFKDADLIRASEYACADSYWCYRFGQDSLRELEELGKIKTYDIRRRLLHWKAQEELEGIEIDEDKRNELAPYYEETLQSLREQAYEVTGFEFNLNSGQDKGAVLFDLLKLTPTPLTETGLYSTAEEHLRTIAWEHPLVDVFIEYASLRQVKSTYIDGLLKKRNPVTYRLHGNINQTVTDTVRLSYSNPNWQNLPVRTATHKRIREVVYAPPGWVLWTIDQAQIEIRYAAHFSQDPRMLAIVRDPNRSYHKETCIEIHQVSPDDDSWDALYKKTKNGNFCVQYWGGAYKLAETLGIPFVEAVYFYEKHRELFPGYHQWCYDVIDIARGCGYTETLSGFRRYIPEIKSLNAVMRSKGERYAINVPIQGSAADHIQIAMGEVYEWMQEEKFYSRMMIQVHDELVGISPKEELDEVVKGVAKRLEHAVEISVPTPVEIKVGDNWGEVEEYEEWKVKNKTEHQVMTR